MGAIALLLAPAAAVAGLQTLNHPDAGGAYEDGSGTHGLLLSPPY